MAAQDKEYDENDKTKKTDWSSVAEFPFEAPLLQSIEKGLLTLFVKTEKIRQRANCGTNISMIYDQFIRPLL